MKRREKMKQLNLPKMESIPLAVHDGGKKVHEIKAAITLAYESYEKLFAHLKPEGFFVRPNKLRHPLIFYYGHTAAFYMNKMVMSGLISEPERINPELEKLVSQGVDEMSWDDLMPDNYNWPSVESVKEYRRDVFNLLIKVIEERLELKNGSAIDWNHKAWAIMMALEHDLIHLETSAMLMRQLSTEFFNPLVKNEFDFNCNQMKTDVSMTKLFNKMIPVQGGSITLGRPMQAKDVKSEGHMKNLHAFYGWDSEFGYESKKVSSFEASQKLISNEEFLEFVMDGGYKNESFWSPEGWRWCKQENISHPTFWIPKEDGKYSYRLLFKEIDSIPLDWPAEVNAFEAMAYCRWMCDKTGKTYRLPKEEEYQLLVEQSGVYGNNPFSFPSSANIGLQKYASPCPVTASKQGDFYDLVGNLWQWSFSAIYFFDGFEMHPLYKDFTEPSLRNTHNLLKGGSFMTCGNYAAKYARNAFRRHFYQLAGFRTVCVKDEAIPLIDCEETCKSI